MNTSTKSAPSEIAINYVAPGTNGVPTAAQGNEGDPTDIYETNFAPENQRNIFRQAMQKRLDISIRKNFHVTDRISALYEFNIFNLTNTTSFDVPFNEVSQNASYNPYPAAGTPVLPGTCNAQGQGTVDGSFYSCPAGLGIVNHTIGSPRQIQMSLSLTF